MPKETKITLIGGKDKLEKEVNKIKSLAMNARDSGYCGGCEEYIKGIDLLISNFRQEKSNCQKELAGKIEEKWKHIFGDTNPLILREILELLKSKLLCQKKNN